MAIIRCGHKIMGFDSKQGKRIAENSKKQKEIVEKRTITKITLKPPVFYEYLSCYFTFHNY